MIKWILAAAFAVATINVAMPANAQPAGLTARDVQILKSDAERHKVATNVPPGIIINDAHRMARSMNQQHRRPHDSRMGRGHRSGSCKSGFAPNRDEGTCERTVVLQNGHPKYDKPHAGCQKGEKNEFTVSLPNDGTRTVRQTCR